jgi:hypothetical protein
MKQVTQTIFVMCYRISCSNKGMLFSKHAICSSNMRLKVKFQLYLTCSYEMLSQNYTTKLSILKT